MSIFDFGDSSSGDTTVHLRRIEAKLDKILDHLGIEFEWPIVSDEVRELAGSGRQIEAIKVHREQTGASLAEAKKLVDSLS